MYVYYDRAGNLKEIINEPVRSGDLYKQTIYIYWDNHPTPVNSLNVKIRLSNGEYANDMVVNPTPVVAKIPYNQDRDLKFFKYNTNYSFFAYTPTTTFPAGNTGMAFLFSTGGTVVDEVLTGATVTALQLLTVFVEATEDLSLGDPITQSQWSYLLNQLRLNNVRAYVGQPERPELLNLGANSLVFDLETNKFYKVNDDLTLTEIAVISSGGVLSDNVIDEGQTHKFVTQAEKDMIGQVGENIVTDDTTLRPLLMADTDITNEVLTHTGVTYRSNNIYVNSDSGSVYATTFYQNGTAVQEQLVNTVNIKSINGESILGSGNITIQGGGGAGTVTSVDSVQPVDGDVELSAVRYVSQSLGSSQQAQARENIGLTSAMYTYLENQTYQAPRAYLTLCYKGPDNSYTPIALVHEIGDSVTINAILHHETNTQNIMGGTLTFSGFAYQQTISSSQSDAYVDLDASLQPTGTTTFRLQGTNTKNATFTASQEVTFNTYQYSVAAANLSGDGSQNNPVTGGITGGTTKSLTKWADSSGAKQTQKSIAYDAGDTIYFFDENNNRVIQQYVMGQWVALPTEKLNSGNKMYVKQANDVIRNVYYGYKIGPFISSGSDTFRLI